MKFKKYLAEEVKVYPPDEETWELIKKECKKFLSDIGSYSNRYLGRREPQSSPVWRKRIRKGRKPTDTPPEVHNKVNELLKKKGLPTRADSLFCVGRKYTNLDNFILPIGNYKFAYNPKVDDFYYYWVEKVLNSGLSEEITLKEYVNDMKKDSIIKAMESTNEILIQADYYWTIKKQWVHEFRVHIGKIK